MAVVVGQRARWFSRASAHGTDRLEWIASAAISATLGVGAITIVGTRLGLSDDAETNDRVILLGWWALAVAVAVMVVRLVSAPRASRAPRLTMTAAVVGLGALVLSLTWTVDKYKFWAGISVDDLALGALLAVALVGVWSHRTGAWRLSPVIMTAVVLTFVIPALIQTPATISDPYHFAFTSDEISSVAAGNFPLSDYIPQYTNLLSFVPALPIEILGNAEWIVTLWLLALQVLAFGCVIALPLSVLPRRCFALASAVVLFPCIAPSAEDRSATAYFAGIPMRVVLPALAILATYHLITSRRQHIDSWGSIGIGLLLGVTALNNPDFGLPAAATCFLLVLVTTSRTFVVRKAATMAAAGAFVFVAYTAAGFVTGNSVNWSYWLAFQTQFGADKTMAEPMASFGIHVAFVSLFVSTFAIGSGLMVRCRGGSMLGRTGVMMTLAGGWGLLTLPYFMSRSLAPTMIQGYSFAAGMCFAAMLPLLAVGYRTLRSRARRSGPQATWIAIAFGAVALVGTLSFFGRVPAPSKLLEPLTKQEDLGRFPPLGSLIDGLDNILNLPANADVRAAVANGQVVQILPMSNLVELDTGIPSVASASNPSYLSFGGAFTDLACERIAESAPRFLIIETGSSRALEGNTRCASLLDFRAARLSAQGDVKYSIIPVRPPLR